MQYVPTVGTVYRLYAGAVLDFRRLGGGLLLDLAVLLGLGAVALEVARAQGRKELALHDAKMVPVKTPGQMSRFVLGSSGFTQCAVRAFVDRV